MKVYVKENNLKRNKWPVAKIEELIESKDNRVRSVILKMLDNKSIVRFYERPIVDLVLLSPA